MTDTPHFPFSAIVDQADMKDALLCNAVHPGIGGVLISGTRGTAKSTAARSLAHLLPPITAVADCPYHCPPADRDRQCPECRQRDGEELSRNTEKIPTPFVTLPIGATEDRVLGTIDLEAAIQSGERAFDPGLLARANRGILYVDEVNLLGDHLVDGLLDAVAMGTNRVEREGVSVEHPADVMLVGTMNPEEGELRPQLLDRFGLQVTMDRDLSPAERKAVVRRRAEFDEDPAGMLEGWRDHENDLAARIEQARDAFPDVEVDDSLLDRIVDVCMAHDVDGLRADIIIHRTARALAALDGTQTVEDDNVTRAAELALGHRANADPMPNPQDGDPDGDGDADETPPDNPTDRPAPDDLPDLDSPIGDEYGDDSSDKRGDVGTSDTNEDVQAQDDAAEDRVFPITSDREPPRLESTHQSDLSASTGRDGHTRTLTDEPRGAYARARRPRGRTSDIALDATIRAAAPHQVTRRANTESESAVQLRPSDLREKHRQAPAHHLIVFVVDASGSMGAYQRMSAVKGAIRSLLVDVYRQRDAVSLVGFRKDGAETLLPPTSSAARAARALAAMPTGGRTPLAAGLEEGLRVVQRTRRAKSDFVTMLVVVTDGRPNAVGAGASPVKAALQKSDRIRQSDVAAVCFDTEVGPVRMGLVRDLAERMGASYYHFDEFDAAELSATITDLFQGLDHPDS